MQNFIARQLAPEVIRLAQYFPAVGILGPRQVGKTTLARMVTANWSKPTLFLDLEDPEHFASLRQPQIFLERFADHTVVLDEVQRLPELFPVLRVLIDHQRTPGRFILLGSASPDLLRLSAETLARRIACLELHPLNFGEISNQFSFENHWLRGGFPGSLLAPDDQFSMDWRKNFVRTYLERDLKQLGIIANPVLLGRFWTMLAHLSGGLVNREKLSSALGLSQPTVQKYLQLFEASFLVRTVEPFIPNVSKRLVKTPKIYLRDTGILHYLMAVPSWQALLGHPNLGSFWETYVVNQVAAVLPSGYEMYFYRTHSGAEADLVLARGGVPEILLEIKFSSSPTLSKGFHISRGDLKTSRHFVVCPIRNPFPISADVEAIGLGQLQSIF